jgi:hypothetical protein
MTTRLEILDMIGQLLTVQLGPEKVTRRPDGILIVAGEAEAFAVQVLTIDAPEGVRPRDFGEDLVRHIEGHHPAADNH